MSTERNALFDYAKGLGILLVVYGHVARGLLNAGIPMDREWHGLIDSIIYSFHMPLFFFLSGLFFLGSMTRHGGRKLVLNKLETIFYPYIVWSLIQGLIETSLAGSTNGSATLGEVFSLLWQPRAHFWFLYTLLIVFLSSVILYRRGDAYWLSAILGVSLILFISRYSPVDIYAFNSFGQWFVYFALGVSTSNFMSRTNAAQNWNVGFVFFAALAFVGSQWAFHDVLGLRYDSSAPVARLVLAVFGITFIMALAQFMMQCRLQWISFLGRHSMEIYLIHVIAGSGIRIALQKLFGIDDPGLHFVSGMIFGIGVPLLVVKLTPRLGLEWLFALPPRLHFGTAR